MKVEWHEIAENDIAATRIILDNILSVAKVPRQIQNQEEENDEALELT